MTRRSGRNALWCPRIEMREDRRKRIRKVTTCLSSGLTKYGCRWLPWTWGRTRAGRSPPASLPSETETKQASHPGCLGSLLPPPTLGVTDKLSPQVTLLVCGLQWPKLFFRSLEETPVRDNHQSFTWAWEVNFCHQRARSSPSDLGNAAIFWTHALRDVTFEHTCPENRLPHFSFSPSPFLMP